MGDDTERTKPDLYEVRARSRAGHARLGLRERNKIEKLERISTATQHVFGRDGYDRATLRAIADEASIALGTLALYAKDKRDLILLMFNQLIPPLIEEGRSQAARSPTLIAGMISFFKPFYRTYAAHPELYRTVLAFAYSGARSMHARENEVIRGDLMAAIAELLQRSITCREFGPEFEVELQVKSFFYIFFAAVRVWLNGETPHADAGLSELQALFEHHIRGLRPAAGGDVAL